MVFKEAVLTSWLLKMKLTKLEQKYEEYKKCKGSPSFNLRMRDLILIKKILSNRSMYCQVCGKEIGEKQIGETIVIQERGRVNLTTKWYHRSCSESKNIVVG